MMPERNSLRIAATRRGEGERDGITDDTDDEKMEMEEYWKGKEKFVYSEATWKDLNSKFEAEADRVKAGMGKEKSREREAEDYKRAIRDANKATGPGSSESRPPQTSSDSSDQMNSTTTSRLPLPLFDVESLGLKGRWLARHGNYILRPPTTDLARNISNSAPVRVKGVIHFLGGAFVGAAPHLSYRYMLEALSQEGYVVVATPYRLDFDYVRSCDEILEKFDKIAVELAREYGPIPVIGIGHSCGALLQTLITCLFPSAPRAANILISFNNKPVTEAIPAFEEVVKPLSRQIMFDEQRVGGNGTTATGTNRIKQLVGDFRTFIDEGIDAYARSPVAPAFVQGDIVPLVRQGLEIVDQLPGLLQSIAEGTSEFQPSPIDTKEVCRRMYRARRTLLLKFSDDTLDESESIEKVLREANTIMRMKRPMVEMEVELRTLSGTHITPLTQNILAPPLSKGTLKEIFPPIPDLLLENPVRSQLENSFLQTINLVKAEILDFLEISVQSPIA